MSANKIVAKKLLGTVVSKGGQQIALSAATVTSSWKRPESVAEKLKDPLAQAVLANEDVLPPGTAEVCSRESEHPSPADTRTHITAGTYDQAGNYLQTVHLPTKK